MPYSYAITTASGSSAVVSVPFPYILKAHVHVSVDGDLVADQDLVWTGPSTITLPSNPGAGEEVKVFRNTPSDNLLATWTANTMLDFRDLNASLKQLLFIVQEAFDAAIEANDIVGDITGYLSQIVAMFNSITTMHGEVQEIWAGSAIFHDYHVSVPFKQVQNAVLASWITPPEDHVFSADTISRMSCHTPTPPDIDVTVSLVHVNRTTGAVINTMGTFTIEDTAYGGTFAVNGGLTLPYTIGAGTVLRLKAGTTHPSLISATYNVATKQEIP